MSEKIIRKIKSSFYVRIPVEMRHEFHWHAETKITAWTENNKIFLRKTEPKDNKNLKFHLSKIDDNLSWLIPKCWRWYYNLKVGDKFEFDYASEKVIVLTLTRHIKKPDHIYKKLFKGGLYIPRNMLSMIQIEPIGGVKIIPQEDKILVKPEKRHLADYFISTRSKFQIPLKIRQEMNIRPDASLELFIENGAIVLKKHHDYGKFAVLSKKTIEDTDKKAMAYFEKRKTNRKKIKREARH